MGAKSINVIKPHIGPQTNYTKIINEVKCRFMKYQYYPAMKMQHRNMNQLRGETIEKSVDQFWECPFKI